MTTMKVLKTLLGFPICFFLLLIPSTVAGVNNHIEKDNSVEIGNKLSDLPLTFRKNMGQWDEQILYMASSPSWHAGVCFMKNELSFCFGRPVEKSILYNNNNISKEYDDYEYLAWKLAFKGSNPDANITAEGFTESKTNYLLGNDPSKYAINVPDYRMIQYNNLYKNINACYYSNGKQLKYDFMIQPGGNTHDIKMECTGIKKLWVSETGELEIHTPWGILTENIPESYQIINGIKRQVRVVYKLYDNTTFGFEVKSKYDVNEELVIDPVTMLWATYTGATTVSDGYLHDIAADAAGNVFATGMHQSFFPTSSGVFQPNFSGGVKRDVFVFKLNPNGTSLIYATYLGGPNPDAGYGIAINAAGEAFVTGWTSSSAFPITTGAFDTFFDGGDAFVTKLNATGTGLLYSTFLSGVGSSSTGNSIVLNLLGEAFVTGSAAANFPVTAGAYDQTFNGAADAFVTKINATGSALIFSTFIGGSIFDCGNAVAVTAAGEIIIAGYTDSNDLPATLGAFDGTFNGGQYDVFVAKFNSAGSLLSHLTYIGGIAGYEIPMDIVINAANETYIVGETSSNDYPVTPGSYDQTHNGFGTMDVFVTKLNATGTALGFSTYIGGNGSETGWGIGLNALDEIFISGHTTSNNFPVTSCAYNTLPNGSTDIFVGKLNSTGNNLHYATYVGGLADDYKHSRMVLLPSECGLEEPIIAGTTHSQNFPVTPGAFQNTNFTLGDDAPVVFRFKKPDVIPGFTRSTSTTCNTSINFTDTTNQCGLWSPLTSWQWDFGDGATSAVQNPAHTYTLAGTYNVKLIVGCPLDSIIIPVTITNIITSAAGVDTSMCEGGAIQLNGIAGGGGTTYSWTPSAGLSNSTIANPIANPTGITNYILTVSNNGLCPAKDTVTVTVNQIPSSVISGTTVICSGFNTTLTAFGSSTYLWNNGVTTNTIVVSPTSFSTFTVIGLNGNCKDTATFNITVNQSPIAVITGTTTICNGNNVGLTASGGTSYSWNTSSTASTITSNPTSNSVYSVTVSYGTCIDTTSINITVYQVPLANAGPDDTLCEGEIIVLSASGGNNYSWDNGIFTNTNSVSPVINSIYTVTVANGPCYDVDIVNIVVVPTPTVNVQGNTTIISGQSTVLSASGGMSYNWSPSSGLSCTNCRYPIANPVQTTTYCVTTINADGCSDNACITIVVNEIYCDELFIPNAFSPNGDNQNDVIMVFSKCIKNINFTIYDRWGNEVFETKDIKHGWDGTYKGKTMNTAVFAYTANVTFTNGEEIIKKGNILLVK